MEYSPLYDTNDQCGFNRRVDVHTTTLYWRIYDLGAAVGVQAVSFGLTLFQTIRHNS